MSDNGLESLGNVLSRMNAIRSFDLSENDVTSNGLMNFLKVMNNHKSLSKLNFKNNKIFEDVGESAVIFTKQNSLIFSFNLERNMLK